MDNTRVLKLQINDRARQLAYIYALQHVIYSVIWLYDKLKQTDWWHINVQFHKTTNHGTCVRRSIFSRMQFMYLFSTCIHEIGPAVILLNLYTHIYIYIYIYIHLFIILLDCGMKQVCLDSIRFMYSLATLFGSILRTIFDTMCVCML